VSIDAAWLRELVGGGHSPEALGEALERIGCDVEEVVDIRRYRCPACGAAVEGGLGADTVKVCAVCGHARDEAFAEIDRITVIRLDLLAARPDLFDIGGLARALRGYLGEAEGLPRIELGESDVVVDVSADTGAARSCRPFIGCAVVRMPPLDDRLLIALMKIQENLHWGVGRDRKLASIGIYDLDTVRPPIRYRTLHPEDEPFEPLGMPGIPMSGRRILAEHPKGTAYAHLLADHDRYPVLEDADGRVLSMPPIINSEATKVTARTRDLFVDVTGISRAAVDNALCTLVASIAEIGGRIETVRVREADGTERVTPDLTPRESEIEMDRAARWLGLPLDADALVRCLRRMRLDVEPLDAARTRFRVRYPAFRSDIRHMVDVFEDVAIGWGYERFTPALVPTMTVSAARPEEALAEPVRAVLMGLGYSEVMSLPMTTEEDHFLRLRLPVPERYPRVGNPKLKALTVVRTHLMTGVMQALGENRRRPMPLRLFEMDNVVVLDDAAPYGTREERRLCFAEAGREAGYAGARAALDALLRELGRAGGYVPASHPTFVEGRCARVEAGPFRGILGEVHPEVITNLGLDHPIALVELTLAAVWP
jgi:phenylalanyl-tRNA synthetase beta chain